METRPPTLLPEHILAACCRFSGLTAAQYRDDIRTPKVAWPRHELVHCLREFTSMSQVEIGQFLGGRDASTVKASLEKVARRTRESRDYAEHLSRLQKFVVDYRPVKEFLGVRERARRVIGRAVLGCDEDAAALAQSVLVAVSVLTDRSLTDAEARQAAIIVFDVDLPQSREVAT